MFLEATVMLIAGEDMSLHLCVHLLMCFGVSCKKEKKKKLLLFFTEQLTNEMKCNLYVQG